MIDKPQIGASLSGHFRNSILSGCFGQGVSLFLGLILIPAYLSLLGPEAYGLIGLLASLQVIFGILDLGLPASVSRELAAGKAEEAANTVFTLHRVHLAAGIGVSLTFIAIGLLKPDLWLKGPALPQTELRTVFILYGFAVLARWPSVFYAGVLRGLERHVLFNSLLSVNAVIRAAGILAVLWWGERSVKSYLLAQIFFSLLETSSIAFFTRRKMPFYRKPEFDGAVLKQVWKFSAGLTGAGALAVLMRQLDKLCLSALLPLSEVGFYAAASALSGLMSFLAIPIYYAAYPRFASLLASGAKRELADLYHKTASLTAALTAPAAGVFIFFPGAVLFAWTRSPAAANETSAAFSLLSSGALFNVLAMTAPHALQLASGRVKIGLYLNLAGLSVMASLMYPAVVWGGVSGAALTWALINFLYFILSGIFTHRGDLHGERKRWVLNDTLPYLGVSLGIPALVCFLLWAAGERPRLLPAVVSYAAAQSLCFWFLPAGRLLLKAAWKRVCVLLGPRNRPAVLNSAVSEDML